MTGPALRLVANGLETRTRARAVLLVFPDKDAPGSWDFYNWPKQAHQFIAKLLRGNESAKVDLKFKSGLALSAELHDPFATYTVPIIAINDLWQRALARSENAADAMVKAWAYRASAPTNLPRSAALPLPVAEAGILLPLENARAGLSAIAPEGSPLHARTPMRPEAHLLSAIGRPWLGQPNDLVRFASVDRGILDDASHRSLFGPPDVGAWLRDWEQGRATSDHPYSNRLDPDEITQTALGRTDDDLLWLFDRMHAFHHAALNGVEHVADEVPARDNKDSPPEDRRLQQLWSSPGLMRLFGFARDVYLDFKTNLPARGLGQFTQIKSNERGEPELFRTQRTAFDLNRDQGLLYPPSRIAYESGSDPTLQDGVRRLGSKSDGGPCYYMTSIEPIGSTDDSTQAQSTGRASRVTTGPIALVSCNPTPASDRTYDGTEFAEELSAPGPDRLDIGIDVENGGVKWYSASPRVVRYLDPRPEKPGEESWPQNAIDSLTPPWLPAWERDSHGLVSAKFWQKGDRNTVVCFDPRLATYSGEAIGARSDSINSEGSSPQWGARPVWLSSEHDLLIDQRIEVPVDQQAILAPRRLGWRYHFGIRRSYLGGAGPTLERARVVYEDIDSTAPFPPVVKGGGGFRNLRHDPISKPVVTLAPEVPEPKDKSNPELQTSNQMVLISRRSPERGASISHTARILVAPTVEPEFAALHEVFDGAGTQPIVADEILFAMPLSNRSNKRQAPLATLGPRQGLKRAWLNFNDSRGQHRFRFGTGEQRFTPYYPDPAACFLVLRLHHPEQPDSWLGSALVIRIRGDSSKSNEKQFHWPDILPVRIDLRAAEKLTDSLKLAGGEIVYEQGQPFRRVTISLLPGESAILKVWAAPSTEDLLAWFDVVERSAQLCETEGNVCQCGPGLACATGRQSLFGEKNKPIGNDEEERRRIAGLYHQRLLEIPVSLFADVADITVVHATDVPWYPARFIGAPVVARPSLENDSLTAYLTAAGPSSDWGPSKAEDGATALIVGGKIEFDQASTSGLIIEASIVKPGDGVLDPPPRAQPRQFVPNLGPKGQPDFGAKVWTEILRIQGIPAPADGRAKLRQYFLEEILLGSLAELAQVAIQFGKPLSQGQARIATFRVVPISRHAPLLRKDLFARPEGLSPETTPVWIPATVRPAAPDVKELKPTFIWNDTAKSEQSRIVYSRTRSTGLRLVLRRPWFSSGEGERVGIVLWPPPVVNLPYTTSLPPLKEIEVPSLEGLPLLTDEVLDPIGHHVSVWGLDPIESLPKEQNNRARFLSWKDFKLSEAVIKYPRVLMPLPSEVPDGDQKGDQGNMQKKEGKEIFVEVAVLSFPLAFSEDASEAYVDLDLIPIRGVANPIVKLSIVRIQPNARLDAVPSERSLRTGIRCSPPVTVQSPLLPERRLIVTSTEFDLGRKHESDGDQTSISVILSGPSQNSTESNEVRVSIELLERLSGEEIPVVTIGGELARAENTGDSKNRVVLDHKDGDASWTATFILRGKIGNREIIAAAREEAAMPHEETNFCDEDKEVAKMPRYFGKIAIKKPGSAVS